MNSVPSWPGIVSVRKILVFAVAFAASIPHVSAAELWAFIRVGKNYVAGPKWETQSGKAQVQFNGDQISIRVFYTSDARGSAPDRLGDARIEINGTLGSDHIIRATYTLLDTDRRPVKLTGQYVTRSDLEIWGEKRKIVTTKEIVFSHPPNSEFLGFLGEGVRDE
jgi:hypothetical protein